MKKILAVATPVVTVLALAACDMGDPEKSDVFVLPNDPDRAGR